MTDLPVPLPQSDEFARTCAAIDHPVIRHQDCDAGSVLVQWQVQSRQMPVLGRVQMISRGPVAVSDQARSGWLEQLRHRHRGGPLILNADGMDPRDLRRAGFWPLVSPATIGLLKLGDAAEMRAGLQQKWRNRLNKAERDRLRVTRSALTSGHWLLAAEAAQARARKYRGLPSALWPVFASENPGKALVFEAKRKGEVLAAALILRHGRMATWQIGVSRPAGRTYNAMNAVLWQAMTDLAAQGHELLDLGILNDEDAPGMTRFKLGTGAQAHKLGGTWLYHRKLAPVARLLPARMAA